ncbi:MAG: hypothetical protein FWC69_05845, partial [Defluviitaleaceae bacterium]|nr:hypothetical protein [Defluviitaleaceae bacterium]
MLLALVMVFSSVPINLQATPIGDTIEGPTLEQGLDNGYYHNEDNHYYDNNDEGYYYGDEDNHYYGNESYYPEVDLPESDDDVNHTYEDECDYDCTCQYEYLYCECDYDYYYCDCQHKEGEGNNNGSNANNNNSNTNNNNTNTNTNNNNNEAIVEYVWHSIGGKVYWRTMSYDYYDPEGTMLTLPLEGALVSLFYGDYLVDSVYVGEDGLYYFSAREFSVETLNDWSVVVEATMFETTSVNVVDFIDYVVGNDIYTATHVEIDIQARHVG